VPLDAKSDFATVARFAHRVGKLLVERDPENLTGELQKDQRVSQSGSPRSHSPRHRPQRLRVTITSATFAATYTVRARLGAPVSAPRTWALAIWAEVERREVSPASFTLRNLPQRIRNVGDLWSDLLTTKLPPPPDGTSNQDVVRYLQRRSLKALANSIPGLAFEPRVKKCPFRFSATPTESIQLIDVPGLLAHNPWTR